MTKYLVLAPSVVFGAFIVIISFILHYDPDWMKWLVRLGGCLMFVGGVGAIYQVSKEQP